MFCCWYNSSKQTISSTTSSKIMDTGQFFTCICHMKKRKMQCMQTSKLFKIWLREYFIGIPCAPHSLQKFPVQFLMLEQEEALRFTMAYVFSLRILSTRKCTSSSGSGTSFWESFQSCGFSSGSWQFSHRKSDSTFSTLWYLCSSKFVLKYVNDHSTKKIHHQFDADLKNHLSAILEQSQLGDW